MATFPGNPAADPLTGAEIVPITQGGVDKRTTPRAISNLAIPPVATESGTSLTADETNSGNYTRFTNSGTKTYTFDSAETYVIGSEYHGRNAGAGDLTITEAGTMTINAPAGGTLVIPEGGTFTVKIVDSDEADLFGVTVPV